MQTSEHKGFAYEFGKFVLDPKEKTLFSDGVPLHLPTKEFETLVLLVENNGRALTKDEMIAAVWHDVFVEEGNLAKQISRLRKIINTDGNDYIETLPKHGYRFTADVKLREAAIKTEPDAPFQRSNRGSSFIIAAVVLAIVAVSAFVWFRSTNTAIGSPVRSIAVLPFRALGNDDEYLRFAMPEAVIAKLGGIKDINVISTGAARRYADENAIDAGRKLGVEAVVEGSIQQNGQQLRATVQVVGVSDGRLLWSGTFDESAANVFGLQDSIARQVVDALRPGTSKDQIPTLAKRYTANIDAHRAYVAGRVAWNKRTADGIKQAVTHFSEAITKDPNYALAYSGLADSYSLLADYSPAPPSETYEKARVAAQKAIELDGELAEAHSSLAYISMYRDWNWSGAEDEYRRAIALNPNYATARQWYSEYLTGMGRFDEALAEIRRAKEIDPLAPIIQAGEVWVLYYARRYDEAIDTGRRIAATNPDFAEIHEYLKRCYDQKGMYREAIDARQTRRRLVGLDAGMTDALKKAAAATTADTYWNGRLEQELAESRTESDDTFNLAEINTRLGQTEKAFEWLERSFNERDYLMMYLKVAPNLDVIRSDPRFAEMLRRTGIQS